MRGCVGRGGASGLGVGMDGQERESVVAEAAAAPPNAVVVYVAAAAAGLADVVTVIENMDSAVMRRSS
jgi:hypothetical protein